MFRRALIFLLVVCAALAAGWLALRRSDIPYDALEARYADNASRFLTLENGLIVHYRDEGLRSGPVIILLHGFSSSLQTWDGWVDELKSDYRIIRFDLPGHGLTRVPEPAALTTHGLSDFVQDMVRALKIDRFTLIGSSMGGHTAWTYAAAHPETLNALVLVGASGAPAEDGAEKEPVVFKLIRNPVIGPILADLDIKPLIRDGVEKSFVDTSLVTDEMIDRYADLSRAPGHRKALLALTTRQEPDMARNLEGLRFMPVPTLVLSGAQDAVVSPKVSAKLAEFIPNAELISYENVGHLPQEEIPAKSVADVQNFLTALSEN